MKTWSDNPIHEEFCINFFLDTNILVYLTDKTYKSLNDFVELLNISPFSRLVSSKYVIFEFIGVRKKEHYFRKAANNSEKTPDGNLNFSSLFKYRDHFNNPAVIFKDEIADIKKIVINEMELISRDYNINFEHGTIHDDQIQPTIEVCLSSKISNHDSLMLLTATLPQAKKTKKIVLLTNDGTLISSFKSADISSLLATQSINAPTLVDIANISNKIKLVGKDCSTKIDIKHKLIPILLDLIKNKLNKLYLGNAFFPVGERFPNDCICFKLIADKPLSNGKNGVHVSVLSKDLDFLYTSKKPVHFWNNGAEIVDGFTSSPENNNISYCITEVNEEGIEIPVPSEVIAALREEGNHVFIHPDTLFP